MLLSAAHSRDIFFDKHVLSGCLVHPSHIMRLIRLLLLQTSLVHHTRLLHQIYLLQVHPLLNRFPTTAAAPLRPHCDGFGWGESALLLEEE